MLNLNEDSSKLLAIVANSRGASAAAAHPEITYLGFPFSISETFQLRNTNATIADSVDRVKRIQDIALAAGKQLVIYISMGFGNPYGDEWNVEIAQQWVDVLAAMDIKIMALSDTIGVATPASITYLFKELIPPYPDVTFGAHLHTQPHNWEEKIAAAYSSGCYRYDAALKGYGGCPMAKDDLTGNMPTENLLYYFDQQGVDLGLNKDAFINALVMTGSVFP